MSYKIVLDSCAELPPDYQSDSRYTKVPLELAIGDYRILDDETFDQADFLKRIAEYPLPAKSACPSPEQFQKAYEGDEEHVYVVTLSSHLSGSYNSAELGKKLYFDQHAGENDKKEIFVIDSWSACCGETQIGFKAAELEEKGLSYEEIKEKLLSYRNKLRTYFVLNNLETLRKNGRLSAVKSLVASTLSIKPVMSATEGVIIQKGKAIGIKKALIKMVEFMQNELPDLAERRIMISHVNCPERAAYVSDLLQEKLGPKNILILNAGGVTSLYANDGGIVVTA